MQATFRKQDPGAPADFFAAEVAGLQWLRAAAPSGGVPVVEVLGSGPHHIELARLATVPPSREQAVEFGRRLARTHATGAPRHGAPPPGLDRDGFIASLPLPHNHRDDAKALPWGEFYAQYRVAPYARAARDSGSLDSASASAIDRVCERLAAGDEELTGPAEAPSRLHGDLWNGNVLWTAAGAVLIDPAAHGGHRETDLAMLDLFGLPYLSDTLAGYQEAAPLAVGHEDRIGLHQMHPLLVHAVLFGSSYGVQAGQVAQRYL